MPHPNHPQARSNLEPIRQRRRHATHTDGRPECFLCHNPIDCQPTRLTIVAGDDDAPLFTAPVHPLCKQTLRQRTWQ